MKRLRVCEFEVAAKSWVRKGERFPWLGERVCRVVFRL